MIELMQSPTFFFLVLGLSFIALSTLVNYFISVAKTRKPHNDKYLPAKAISNIDQRYNKNNWE